MFTWVEWQNSVALWWMTISLFSALNICTWFWLRYFRFPKIPFSSLFCFRQKPSAIIWLSFIYVFVCSFRSFLPRADVQRIVLFDTWFSSVFVGRSLATMAELAFVAQWSIVLMNSSHSSKLLWPRMVGQLALPVIFIAESCSWYAVISTHYLGNVLEESLWCLTYVGIGSALLATWRHLKGPMKHACGYAVFGCLIYVCFMIMVDVPMYWGRLQQDTLAGKSYLGFFDGLHDLNTRWVVSHNIEDWKSEIPWMTAYFTLASMASLALCLLPLNPADWKKHFQS